MDRRAYLTYGFVVGTISLGGCLSENTGSDEDTPSNQSEETPEEREYDAENPFTILLVNDGGSTRSVEMEVSRNGDDIFDDTLGVDAGERITVTEYGTTGRYTIRAETNEHQMETSADIKQENLQTHRAVSGQISVDDEGVLIQVMYDD